MFYYAVLNENNFVVELVASETEISDSTYISITEDQYTNGDLLWLYYSQGQFIVCDNFIGSSDWIIYKNTDRPITPKFDEIDAQIAEKADSDHNHDGDYAALNHTHTEYAAGTHNHDDLYAAKTHEMNTNTHVTATEKTEWNSKAAGNHNHDASYATINHAHTDYSGINHTHTSASGTAAGFISAADKSKLDGIDAGANLYTHPDTHPASMITGLPTSLPANGGNADTVDNCHASDFASATHDHDSDYAALGHNHSGTYAAASHTHTEYSSTSHSHSTATTAAAGFMSGTDKAKLNGIAANANNYSHPASHPASMITETDGLKIMTAAERTKLSGIAENANNYTHPASHAASMITGLASVATSGSYTDLTNKPSTFTPAAHTHAQSEITGLETELSGKASANHTHTLDGVVGLLDLLLTSSTGAVKETVAGDFLATVKAKPMGIYTFYTMGGSTATATNVPRTSESWRYVVHKTANAFGWVLAFGSTGSVFTNYLDNGTWQGWKAIYDASPEPLWAPSNGTGGYYMTDGHTVTPTKKLSECRNGWLLMWSDYNSDEGKAYDYDWHCSMIPKIRPSGETWAGHSWLFDIPAGMQTVSPYTTETRKFKWLYVYDNKLGGTAANNQNGRNDIVLRAVYEW